MMPSHQTLAGKGHLPDWVPKGARRYLAHTEAGKPIRELARQAGCHASTVLRQVRKIETRRDDPLVDEVLRRLGASLGRASEQSSRKETKSMAVPPAMQDVMSDEVTLSREGKRVLRRLCETGAVLAVAAEMDKAVVVRDTGEGTSTRTAVVDSCVAQAMALKEWITCVSQGRISRYAITPLGRSELEHMLADEMGVVPGFAEAATGFVGASPVKPASHSEKRKRIRYNLAESPLTALARRRDKGGEKFLSDELVAAGERLREDFELAQIGPNVTQNWESFLTAGARSGMPSDRLNSGPQAARERVAAAFTDLGPGLSDMALRCCCHLEGLEAAERRMGWSARSGKIVLRIALQRLHRHYEETYDGAGPMIG